MSPEAQRAAIAEICGWKRNDKGHWKRPGERGYNLSPVFLPSYLHDLNDMYAAEKHLDGYLMHKYVTELLALTGGPGTAGSFSHVHASAPKRAEAFLRAFGKWVD